MPYADVPGFVTEKLLDAKFRQRSLMMAPWLPYKGLATIGQRLQRLAQIIKVQVTVDAPEQVIGGDVLVEAEIIRQPRRRPLKPHHSPFLLQNQQGFTESRWRPNGNE